MTMQACHMQVNGDRDRSSRTGIGIGVLDIWKRTGWNLEYPFIGFHGHETNHVEQVWG